MVLIFQGYPYIPQNTKIPKFLDEAYAIRDEEYPYIERGKMLTRKNCYLKLLKISFI